MREYVNQSQAARIKGVSRQYISQLVSKGRLSVPQDDKGKLIKGAVYIDELDNLDKGVKLGRPRLSKKEREARGLDTFKAGDAVLWTHTPRDGYGYTMDIEAKVVKEGAVRVLLAFKDAEGVEQTTWVNKNLCKLL